MLLLLLFLIINYTATFGLNLSHLVFWWGKVLPDRYDIRRQWHYYHHHGAAPLFSSPAPACDHSHHYQRQHTRNSTSLFNTSAATATTTISAIGAPTDSRLQYPPFTIGAATVVNNTCSYISNPRLHEVVLSKEACLSLLYQCRSGYYDHLRQ
jgi:hypothetical protein